MLYHDNDDDDDYEEEDDDVGLVARVEKKKTN